MRSKFSERLSQKIRDYPWSLPAPKHKSMKVHTHPHRQKGQMYKGPCGRGSISLLEGALEGSVISDLSMSG